MSAPTQTTDRTWIATTAITVAVVLMLWAIAAPSIWMLFPAFAVVATAIWLSIRFPEIKNSAGVAAIFAALAGGISIFFG